MRTLALTVLAVMALTFGALALASTQGSDSPAMDHGSMDHSMDQPMDHDVDHATDHSAMDHNTMQEDHENHAGQDEHDNAAMEHDHEQMMQDAAEAAEEDGKEVGIEEHLSSLVAEAMFKDSEGNDVNLRELIDAPTILLPIYYRCPDVCNLLQSNFSQILPEVKLEPGKELKIISFSFDPRENPKDAARAKRQYIAALQGGFPAEHWHFLTADQENIDKALDSIGYTVRRQGGLYAHPVAVVSVAPGGKIVRYLYGPGFLPMDVTIAATKAAQGIEALSVKRLLSMCYSYDPEGRRYAFSTLRVAGFSIMTFVAIFLAFLMFGGKKKKQK